MRFNRFLQYSLIALASLSLVACDEDETTKTTVEDEDEVPIEDPEDPVEDPEDPIEDPEDPIVDPDEPDDVTPDAVWTAILMPAMATDVDLANKGTVRLGVNLISATGDTVGEGIVGEKIHWGIESGDTSVSLKGTMSRTQEEGLAQQTLKALGVEGDAVVVASSTLAPKDVRFNVTVATTPTGKLKINTSYKGVAPVSYYSIRLYDGIEAQCYRLDLKSGSVADVDTDEVYDPLFDPVDSDKAIFDDLTPGASYTAIAFGYSEAGAPVAYGCLDSGLKIYENQTTTGLVNLEAIPLDFAHTYHVRSYFDLGDVTNALGTVGTIVNTVLDFATNPGRMLYDLVIDVIQKFFAGASVIDKVLSWFGADDLLVNYINEVATSNKVTCKAGLFACQFRDLVRLMEFIGQFSIMKVGDIELAGKDTYQGIAVYWRMNCDGTDPNCGRYALTTDMLTQIEGNQIDQKIDFLSGSWAGSLANGYDKISVESHELRLYYGQILVYLVEKLLIPKVTKNQAASFEELLEYWINCTNIGTWIYNQILKLNEGWTDYVLPDKYLPKSAATTIGWCKTAVKGLNTLIGFATAYAEMQSAGSEIKISGTAKLKDTNADNVIDDIYDGVWSGSMTITTSSEDDVGNVTSVSTTTAVEGIWSAYNLENVKNSDGNLYCTTPKTATDSDDQSCSYPSIDRTKLNNAGLCSTYAECAN